MTAHGKHPFYVLGKGLFFRSWDLHAFGGFHPWLTIEDPEVGMRLWTNGRRLGVVPQPLVEEVPRTFRHGVTQRKRWVCGFFQSLGGPLTQMGMTAPQRFRARLNLVPACPCSSIPSAWPRDLDTGQTVAGHHPEDLPLTALSVVNIVGAAAVLVSTGSTPARYRALSWTAAATGGGSRCGESAVRHGLLDLLERVTPHRDPDVPPRQGPDLGAD